MIAEVPRPECVPVTSPFRADILLVRRDLTRAYHLSRRWTYVNRRALVTGVGFYDALHGQAGAAPNGFELHPVLSIRFYP